MKNYNPDEPTFTNEELFSRMQDYRAKLVSERLKCGQLEAEIERLKEDLEVLSNLREEKIYVSTDSPDNVYAAFTDRYRADMDCEESGVTWCAVTLYRGPKKI